MLINFVERVILDYLLIIIYLFLLSCIHGKTKAVSSQCTMTEVKSLLEGCDRLTGLNITTVGGTIINDHNCDVLLPKQVFLEEPLYQYVLADTKKFYTLIMVDPDASPQLDGEFYLHMLKSNIPGVALKSKESSKTVGVDYRGYKPPMPPRATGVHRYLSLLYEQGDGNNFLPTVPPSRNHFALAKWLLGKSLCGPVAGTEFRKLVYRKLIGTTLRGQKSTEPVWRVLRSERPTRATHTRDTTGNTDETLVLELFRTIL